MPPVLPRVVHAPTDASSAAASNAAAASRPAALPPGFRPLIASQFASALADNALLIVTMALLARQGHPAWWAPLLKFGFTLCYVLFAPFIGPLADAFPKARMMAAMNAVKIVGMLGLLLGLHPVLAFTLVGFGAAAYAPAKYGLVTELVPGRQLVVANAWIEVSVVGAALLGTVAGGGLVSQWALAQGAALAPWFGALGQGPTGGLAPALWLLMAVQALALVGALRLPDSGARYPAVSLRPARLMREFWQANRALWRDREGGLSLAVTTWFWGLGAVLQFMVLRWAGDVLDLSLSQASSLQALVAVGAMAGAAGAARCVSLAGARRVLPVGIVLGLLLPLLAETTTPALAWLLLVLAGLVGGWLVVPMNALLQHRGCTLLSAGRSVAVQGFNENASMLVLLLLYAGLLAAEWAIQPLMWCFGLATAALMTRWTWRERRAVA